MKLYNIKLCDEADIDKVKNFINQHWKKNHALTLSQSLLDFQHYEAHNNTYNFIIALNTLTNEIDGLIGFISTSHYDSQLSSEKDYWGAIWKIREDVENEEIKTLGLYLFERFKEITSYNTYGAIGISAIAKKLYKALRYTTGALNQFYILNEHISEFKIARLAKVEINNAIVENASDCLKEIKYLSDTNPIDCFYHPKKTITYLINRYQNHPVYKYRFLGRYEGNQLRTILVVRVVSLNDAKVIRMVDLLGKYEDLSNIYMGMQTFLKKENAEYIDCLNFGIPDEVFLTAGFTKLVLNGDIIIPTYFEPFEKNNVQIEFAYKSSKPYMIFKGDSDQDRPNIIYDKG